MWQKRQFDLLGEEIEALLADMEGVPGLKRLAREAVERSGALGGGKEPGPPWPLLPMAVCEGISGQCDRAIPVAAAIQLFKSAAEVFDDIEDADSTASLSSIHGPALAINAATALLVLAERAIARLSTKGVPDGCIVRVVDKANTYYTAACAGQHLDLARGSDASLSEETYLEITAMKGAAQVECACCTGAMVSGTENEIVDLYSTFGRNLGIAAQIANDIQGITSGADIRRRKATLPAIYAMGLGERRGTKQLQAWFSGQGPEADTDTIREVLFESGGVHYAVVRAAYYKEGAAEALLKARPGAEAMTRLGIFLD